MVQPALVCMMVPLHEHRVSQGSMRARPANAGGSPAATSRANPTAPSQPPGSHAPEPQRPLQGLQLDTLVAGTRSGANRGSRALQPEPRLWFPELERGDEQQDEQWDVAPQDEQRREESGRQCQAPKRRHRVRRNRGELKLAECLEALEAQDAHCVLRATGLARLGADAAALVKRYFEDRYGPVDKVLLANSTDARSIMGFVVVRSAEDARRALADGLAHEVQPGAVLKIRAFDARCDQPCKSAVGRSIRG